MDSARPEDSEIFLRRRVPEHINVHGGCHGKRGSQGKKRRGKKAIRNSVGRFCENVCGGRCDQCEVGPEGKVDVCGPLIRGHAGGGRKHLDNDIALRQGSEGKRRDKLRCRRSHENLNIRTGLYQLTDDQRAFVCRNPPGDTKQYVFASKHENQP